MIRTHGGAMVIFVSIPEFFAQETMQRIIAEAQRGGTAHA
jgi:hypothetical protein